jgi:GH35 family endo-1,4-beta-xylanase
VLEVVTDLNADQKSRITPIADDATAKLAAWQQSSQRALAPVLPQYAAGQVAYEHEIKEYNAEVTKQNALRDEIINDAEAKLLAILTPAQAEKWQQARLNAAFTTHFAALEVTDAQKAKVDPIIAESAKKLAAAKDKSAIASAKAEFVTKSLGVLDAEQAQRYLPPGARGGARGAGAVNVASEAGLKAQADAYARVFTIFVKHKDAMDRVTFWGLNDARSWRAPTPALIFDANNQRKPAYNAIVDALANPVAPPAPQ